MSDRAGVQERTDAMIRRLTEMTGARWEIERGPGGNDHGQSRTLHKIAGDGVVERSWFMGRGLYAADRWLTAFVEGIWFAKRYW